MKRTKEQQEIWDAAQEVVFGRVEPNKDFDAKVQAENEKLCTRWYASGEQDIGVYDDFAYVYELFGSQLPQWKLGLETLIKVGAFLPDTETFFDYHGGMGMTACRVAMAFPDAKVYSHSVVEQHRTWTHEIAEKLGLKNVLVVEEPTPAQVLLALETFEHIKDPFADLDMLLSTSVLPRQYYDSTSFTIDSTGHYSFYELAGQSIPRRQARKKLFAVLRRHGFKEYWLSRPSQFKKPWNGTPSLWDAPELQEKQLTPACTLYNDQSAL